MAAKQNQVARSQIRNAILDILQRRGAGKTCCPSEVARRVSPGSWRELMEPTRDEARSLRAEGILDICQKGEVVGETWSGPIRLRLRNSMITPSKTWPTPASKLKTSDDSTARSASVKAETDSLPNHNGQKNEDLLGKCQSREKPRALVARRRRAETSLHKSDSEEKRQRKTKRAAVMHESDPVCTVNN